MAQQKKTSSGSRTGAKKTASGSRSSSTKKRSASTSRKGTGSRTQAKKPASRSGASRSRTNTSSRGRGTAASTRSRSTKSASSASRGGSRVADEIIPRQPAVRQAGCVALLFLGLITAIAYFPVDAWLVRGVRTLFFGLVGWGFYLVPVCLLWCSGILGLRRDRPVAGQVASVLLLPLVFGAFIHMLLCAQDNFFVISFGDGVKKLWRTAQFVSEHCGGVLGGTVGVALKRSIGIIGSFLVLVVAFVLLLMEGMSLSVTEVVDQIRSRPLPAREPNVGGDREDYPDDEEFFAPDDYLYPIDGGRPIRRVEPPPDVMPAPAPKPAPQRTAPQPAKKPPVRRSFYDQSKEQSKDALFAEFDVDPETMAKVTAALDARTAQKTGRTAPPADKPRPARKSVSTARTPAPTHTEDVEPMDLEEAADIAGVQIHSADMDEAAGPGQEKLKIDKDAEARAVAEQIEAAAGEDKPEYVYPPVDLLNASGDESYGDDVDLDETEEQLESAIRSFGVGASIVGAVHGPTITRYELKLEQGVKLNKITNLAGDIALSLGVVSVRIAPIPDKISTVGVEVPNKSVRTVWLGDLIDSDAFRNAKNKLSVALGKDIGGNIIVGNIAKMPHVLIAGTTGSGKSVCINSLILSLLYKSTPDEVRMIMIDPKMVELGIYNGMPHLFVPVVTDPKKAAGALQWSVVEMLKRYRLFSEAGVRDLAGYNAVRRSQGEETLPQVVIIIDELADLMMVASKEVEESICRVAQMGRAAGMHLVVATQRPSADVITGLMKANIPSRIAFAVSSALESRIILDQQGAEKLVGSGDMLYSPIGSKPIRVQGAFVTDEEREEIINFVKKEAEAEYSDEILAEIEKAAVDKSAKGEAEPEPDKGKSDYDELLPQAVDVIFETKQASVSMLQRRLKLGYSRAARLIDQLEEVGVVGPYEGSKPRQIVITKEQWQEMQYSHGTAPVDTIAHEFAQVAESDEFASTEEETGDDAGGAELVREDPEEDGLL